MQDWQFGIPPAGRPLQLALRRVRFGIAAAHWFPAALGTLVGAHAHAGHAVSPVIALNPRAKLWKENVSAFLSFHLYHISSCFDPIKWTFNLPQSPT